MSQELQSIEDNYKFLKNNGPRPIGSPNLNSAVNFFSKQFNNLGFQTRVNKYPTKFWDFRKIRLELNGQEILAIPNPFSPYCNINAKYSYVSSIKSLQNTSKNSVSDKILILGGVLTKDILFPLKYSFFNIPEHQETYRLLNALSPLAVIFISHFTFNPSPLSQDIDFKIPSITVSAENGIKILEDVNNQISIEIDSELTESESSILRGRLNPNKETEIALIAHLDTQFFSPGAHDDASGVLTLVETMNLLAKEHSSLPIEFILTTGHEHTGDGERLLLDLFKEENISLKYFFNIDGIGHKLIQDNISYYNIPDEIKSKILKFQETYEISEGPQWPEGIHSVLAHAGIKCFAITSHSLDIHHTPKDFFRLLSIPKLKNQAKFIYQILKYLS